MGIGLTTMTIPGWCSVFPVEITDSHGISQRFEAPPDRVACLVPSVTEMMVAFGKQDVLVGLTRQDMLRNSGLEVVSLGNYFHPDMDTLARLKPDLIIAGPSHEDVAQEWHGTGCPVIIIETGTLDQAFSLMEDVGKLFDCRKKALEVIEENRRQIALVQARLSAQPDLKRKRVVRVLGVDKLSCPGDDSFQNEVIRSAGGLTPQWGRNGFAVPVPPKEWTAFDPQFIYGCDLNKDAVMKLLNRDGYKQVTALETGSIAMFPCDLTCRASVRTGAFVQELGATLYPYLFSDPAKAVTENTVLSEKSIDLPLGYVSSARVVTHRVWDADYKSLCISLSKPMAVLSTLEGPREGIRGVGNTHVPKHASLGHMLRGIDEVKKAIAENLKFSTDDYAGLMTGASMDNLSVQTLTSGDLTVTALVTAGVRGNALRVAEEFHAHDMPGTINIIVMANRRLSPAAMAWAMVMVTEAKTTALSDLDIRSTHTPLKHQATGTGTDTIIIVEGQGKDAPWAGGHTPMGQMIANAVYQAVTEAIGKQNGILKSRSVLQRLSERHLRLETLAKMFHSTMETNMLASQLEKLLCDPYYASFVETALALDDALRTGRIGSADSFDSLCETVAARISGKNGFSLPDVSGLPLTPMTAKAFSALVKGISETPTERNP